MKSTKSVFLCGLLDTVIIAMLSASALYTTTPDSVAAAQRGEFRVRCDVSKVASVDPIVMPGMLNMSHSHTFFGNKSTDQSSTSQSLLAAKQTTCTRPGDTSAYWIPTVLQRDVPVTPNAVDVYYRTVGVPGSLIQPIPPGLKMITGSSKATAQSKQPISEVSWACTNPNGGEVEAQDVPSSCGGHGLRIRYVFPQCWNGVALDSPDHQSHMAYSSHGKCPVSHPVPLPSVTLSLHYNVPDTQGITLASGGQYSLHADLFAAWQPGVQENLISDCIKVGSNCKAE